MSQAAGQAMSQLWVAAVRVRISTVDFVWGVARTLHSDLT